MTFLFEHFGTLLAGVHLWLDRKLTNWLNRDPDIVKFTMGDWPELFPRY